MASDDEYHETAPPARRSLRTRPAAAPAAEAAPARRSLKPTPPPADEDDAPAPRAAKPATGSKLRVRRGWSAGEQVIDSTSSFAQNFKPSEGTTVIKFLEDEPYASYSRHWVERVVGGKKQTRTYTCLDSVGQPCPLCEQLGDRPQAVSAFNIAIVGDDGEVSLKSWDVGVKIFRQLQTFHRDPKIGPLTKGFYGVTKSGRGQNSTTTVIPIKASMLLEDYDIQPPTEDQFDALGRYDEEIVDIPKKSALQEIADELSDSGDYA